MQGSLTGRNQAVLEARDGVHAIDKSHFRLRGSGRGLFEVANL